MRHNADPLFNGVPTRFDAVRYHSWIVPDPLPSDLEPIAWCEETDPATGTRTDIIMALKHKSKPMWGVLFHPESVCTQHGKRILQNFVSLSTRRSLTVPTPALAPLKHKNSTARVQHVKYSAKYLARQTPAIFKHLFSGADGVEKFWLDSSRAEAGLSRFSYMGATNGPLSETLRYNLNSKTVTVSTLKHDLGRQLTEGQDFFSFVRGYLQQKGYFHDESLPFDFQCGLVGYFGYEMKYESLAKSESPQQHSSLPDAYLLFVDRMLVIDHQLNDIYVIALMPGTEIEDWLQSTIAEIQRLDVLVTPSTVAVNTHSHSPRSIHLRADYETYTAQINECLQQIALGESYELCLTNQLVVDGCTIQPFEFYEALRDSNPAPYASFFDFKNFAVVSSSPEKFISVDRQGLVESKPIKGTIKRGATVDEDNELKKRLQTSKKDFVENLMITDLIRNDLGRVCQIGSVCVPKLMDVESYATVHQLVTTVQGQLSPHQDAVDCFKAAFPPGSMTGAPKLRSTQILERLEGRPRGIYSGAIGFFSLNQTCHFNVVIRTAVLQSNSISIGCGGALVMESKIDEEFDEVLLKGRALVRTLVRLSGETDSIQIQGTTKKPEFDGVKYLEDLSTKSGALDLSLDRIKRVLSLLNEPQEKVPLIHVTGTNGKGSVCAYISSVLIEKGLKVGRFTSPHLIRWHESIQINNLDIADDELNDLLFEIHQLTQRHSAPLSQFEALTVAAYLYFFKSNCDVNVIEVGMGGRDDATNVCSSPLVCVITSIGLDHMAFLGNTHAKIAQSKAGIIKAGRPCVISGKIVTEARNAIEDYARELLAALHVVNASATLLDEKIQLAEFEGLKYRLPLLGEHQLMNSALAITALRVLARTSSDQKFKVTDSDIADGMFRVRWPARLQFIVWNNKRVLIDGAHNEEGGRALRQYINTLKAPDGSTVKINWIMGMLSSKDHNQFFKETLAPGDSLCVVPVVPNVDWLFTADTKILAQKAHDICPQLGSVREHASVYEALDALTAQHDTDDFVQPTNRLIVVSGSLHLCGNVLARAVQFSLLETMLYDPTLGGSPIFMLHEHLTRLSKSAHYFNIPVNLEKIRQQLLQFASTWSTAKRIRLLIHPQINNQMEIQTQNTSYELDKYPSSTLKLAAEPISKRNVFLYHKSTHRNIYEDAKRNVQNCDDVVLFNEEGEVTETTIGNIAVRFNAIWYTPPISSGLLAGCMRQHLINQGALVERVITVEELKAADEVKLLNSVRGTWLAQL
jgi:para-aminobenzoate synthetase